MQQNLVEELLFKIFVIHKKSAPICGWLIFYTEYKIIQIMIHLYNNIQIIDEGGVIKCRKHLLFMLKIRQEIIGILQIVLLKETLYNET